MVRSAAWGGKDFPLLTPHGLLDTWGGGYGYTADYGMPGNTHPGYDITMPIGTRLYALADGKVDYVRAENYPTGTKEIVILTDGGHRHLYTHTSARDVAPGQRVTAGQLIGRSGDPTGLPHLHFEHRVPDSDTASGWRIVDPGPLLTTATAPAGDGTGGASMALPIKGASLGNPQETAEKAIARGGRLPDRIRRFASSLWAACDRLGIRADVAWAQCDLETGDRTTGVGFRSDRWVNEGNPSGMGITPDKPDSDPGTEGSPEWWGIVHATHLAGYAGIEPPPEWRAMDFRWDAMMRAGYFGVAKTVHDLDGRWAVPGTDYGRNITARHALYGFAAQQPYVPGGTTPPGPPKEPEMAVRFEKRIATNRLGQFGTLRDSAAYFTIHENGNPSSSPYDEAGFVASGGGSQGVMYHFAVGVEGGVPTIVQIFPVNRRGIHAGNSEGNAKSIAVETCMAPPGATSAPTQEALRELMYMLYTKDARIEGINAGYTFSPDRTVMHADWPGANPGCPQTMLAQWGGIQRPLAAVRQRLAGSPELPKPVPGATVSAGDQVAVSVDGLNVRAEPTTAAAVVQLAGPGAVLDVTGASTEADGYIWWPVKLGAATGYVAEKGTDGTPYIVVVKDAPAPPAPDPDQFARAVPILEIATPVPYVKLANGSRLYRYQAKGKAVRATKLGQYASEGARSIAPDAAAGDALDLAYIVINPDASMYWYTDQHARVKFEDVEPVS